MPSQMLTTFTTAWFGLLSVVVNVAVLIIAAAIVGYSFEWGRHLYQRRNRSKE